MSVCVHEYREVSQFNHLHQGRCIPFLTICLALYQHTTCVPYFHFSSYSPWVRSLSIHQPTFVKALPAKLSNVIQTLLSIYNSVGLIFLFTTRSNQLTGYIDINPTAQTTLLFVHGWPSIWSTWARQIEEFEVCTLSLISCMST